MTTATKLINIFTTSYSLPFLCVVRTLQIHTLHKFQAHSIVSLTRVTMLKFILSNWNFVLFDQSLPGSLAPHPLAKTILPSAFMSSTFLVDTYKYVAFLFL